MAQYTFGSGKLVGKQSGVANATPREFGVLQEVSLDFAATTKQLMGQYSFAVAVGRGAAKITGKARFGRIYAAIFSELFFGGAAPATGQTIMFEEGKTVATNSVTASNTTGFVDLGVKGSDGSYFTKVASAPAAGQYSVTSGGVYSFNSGDANAANGSTVTIGYTYTVATGKTITITNTLLGTAPQFETHLWGGFSGKNMYLKLNACMSAKLTIATKTEDFVVPEFDFEAFADGANAVGVYSSDE